MRRSRPGWRPVPAPDSPERGIVDDRAVAGGAGHRRDLVLEAVKDAGEVLPKLGLPGLGCHRVHRPGCGHPARVVERAVQPAELRHRRLDQPLDVGLHRDVGGDEQRAATVGAQLRGGLFAHIRAPSADHHRGTVRHGAGRYSPPDTGPSPGDQHNLCRKTPSHETDGATGTLRW